MNDEIKEIKHRLQLLHAECNPKAREEDINYTLDYITNLQQQLHQASLDIQELTERDIGCPSWCDKLTNLQQENERLKELNENASKVCMAEHRYGVDKAEEAQDYKSRCEKAIKYIDEQKKKMYKSRNKIALFILMKLENILQNGGIN